MAKTFEFDNDLPPLPLPDLKDTLSTYLESLRPLVTSEKEFAEVEDIVREFENGIGQELHERLQQRAAVEKNWVRDVHDSDYFNDLGSVIDKNCVTNQKREKSFENRSMYLLAVILIFI